MRLVATLLLIAGLPVHMAVAASIHQHGVAQLDMVIEPPMVAITLTSPLANLTGFEHQPTRHEELAVWDATLVKLRQADELIRFPEGADCSLSRVELHLPYTPDSHEQMHHHAHEHETSHSAAHADLMAEYQYLCADSRKLNALELPLMHHFPAIEHLELQLITPDGQHRHMLNAGHTRLSLP
ncbi:ZrgA family zinc uptake protein [Marinobacterium sediminicola]|uniref:DUF2796 domain-containing protein n=1 Tax=Marinobacterium sediminicola TaxID=518898 RepID=A0ABY1RWJ6_9GAMM|nr:DUF2796 domain-containing protein [Marinobacterium sediminicola]ULG70283.1 DUF2796 domain-containing protein [Marinobacterium sediminicola]SMR69858.1 Protein of unknown function [Marinobacterium sediminicola]